MDDITFWIITSFMLGFIIGAFVYTIMTMPEKKDDGE